MATPCGVAKNTTSQALERVVARLGEGEIARVPRRFGNMSATGMPASLRDVITVISTADAAPAAATARRPVYPVPPTMPILIVAVAMMPRELAK